MSSVYNQKVFFECKWILQRGGVNFDCIWSIIQKGPHVHLLFKEIQDADDWSSVWDEWQCRISIDLLEEVVRQAIKNGTCECDSNPIGSAFTLQFQNKKMTITFVGRTYGDNSVRRRTVEIHHSVLASLGCHL